MFRNQSDSLKKTDQELFGGTNIPEDVKKTFKYRERKKIWDEEEALAYVKEKTPLELFQKLSNTSQTIKNTKRTRKGSVNRPITRKASL